MRSSCYQSDMFYLKRSAVGSYHSQVDKKLFTMCSVCGRRSSPGMVFESLLSNWQNFEPSMASLLSFWAIFYVCKWPNIEKNIFGSHLVTLMVPRYLLLLLHIIVSLQKSRGKNCKRSSFNLRRCPICT